MFDLVLYNLSTSWGLMAAFLSFIFIVGCVLYIYTRKFKVEGKRVKAYGLLLNMKSSNILVVSIIIVRTFLIIYSLVTYNQNIWYYILMVGLISLLLIIVYFKNIIYEVINSVALMTIIFFNYQLSNYLMNIENTSSIVIVKGILISFGLLYTIYLFLKEFEDITEKHENIN